MTTFGMLRKLVIVLTFSTIIKSQIDPIEEPQCIIEDQRSVICKTYDNFDIRQEFELISSTHPNEEKLFDQLIIYHLPVYELPENTFIDLQFTQISIYQTYNLTTIHTNAFQSTTAFTEHLYLIGTKVLVNNPPDYDLYAAISSLSNLKTVTINLHNNMKHEIPSNAFRQINGPQSNLEVIAFRGDFVISRIDNNAFNAIPNLRKWILFNYIQIESISAGAFNFEQTSTDRLELHFKGCGLNESSFEANVFSNSRRPLYIDLDSNQIRYIRQNAFSPFFNAHPNNSISLANNPLDCDYTQEIQWLLDYRDQLQHRVLNAECSDGTLLWDIGFDDQCIVNETEIVCSVNGSLALKSEFKRIAQTNPTQTYYEILYIENYPIFTTIPDDVFMGLVFDTIFIGSSPNLMNIHRNAFISTANTTRRLWLSSITQLRNTPPEYDVYYALSTLVNATYFLLAFDPSVSHLIPENAFRNVNGVQSSLYQIAFIGGFNISRIGNNAFYEIPDLGFISFEVERITTVSSRAFDFSTASETVLRIYFYGSQLTHMSLENSLFSGSKRPLIVNLVNNQIVYIENTTFSAFFAADSRNQLILTGNLLNCSDINRFTWLLDQRNELESRVTNAMCDNGTYFWDLLIPTQPPEITPPTSTVTTLTTEMSTSTYVASQTPTETVNITESTTKEITSTKYTTPVTNTTQLPDKLFVYDFEFIFLILGSVISLASLIATVILTHFYKNRLQTSDEFKWLCQTWSVLIHYIFMTAYSWILLKSIYMQKITSKLFPNYYAINYIHYALTYGVSLFICIIIITVIWLIDKRDFELTFDDTFYKDGDMFCWLSSSYDHERFWIIQCPAVVFLIVSFWFIVHSIRSRNKNSKLNPLNRDYSWVYGFALTYSVFFLLWFALTLYVSFNKGVFLYLYVILNCFQAILILAFQAIRVYKIVHITSTTSVLLDNSTSITT